MIYLYLFGTCFHFIYVFMIIGKYDVSIGFTCGESSDTHGLYDDQVVIEDNKTGKNIVEAGDWWLSAEDLK